MEDSDLNPKTTALKKAYAEIILNTVREAASRVMVSERKSVRFHQDLCSTKEEALWLLVRLKQMIDAKTIEAEIMSSNQQSRIDELEAQLQEAEDIITDLRSEMNWVRDKLEKARIKRWHSLNETNRVEEAISTENSDVEIIESLHSNQGVADTCISETKDSPLIQSLLHNKCGIEVKHFDGFSVSNSGDCDSELMVIMKNKELDLHSNGCIQMRALERNVLDGDPPAHVEDQGTSAKDVSSGKVDKNETDAHGNRRCTVLALRAMSVEVIKKPPNPLGTKKTDKAKIRRRRRRRKRRWGKPKVSQSDSAFSFSKASMDNSSGEKSTKTHLSEEGEKGDAEKGWDDLAEHLQHKRTQYTKDIEIIHKEKRNKNIKSLDSICCIVNPTDQLVEARQESNLLLVNVKVDADKTLIPDNKAKIKPPPIFDPGLTITKNNADPISGSTNVSVSLRAPNRSKPEADKDLESENRGLLMKCDSIVVSSTKMGSEMVDLRPHSPDLKVTAVSDEIISESPRKIDGSRVVKYTFQRKRKNNIAPVKRKVKEKENGVEEAN